MDSGLRDFVRLLTLVSVGVRHRTGDGCCNFVNDSVSFHRRRKSESQFSDDLVALNDLILTRLDLFLEFLDPLSKGITIF